MFQKIFDTSLINALSRLPYKELTEIRLRADKPAVIYIKNQPYYLSNNGMTANREDAIYPSVDMLENIVFRASDCSLYATENQISQGYLTLSNGARIGLSGLIVEDNNKIKTITNFNSLNIRIPHQVNNCALPVFKQLVSEEDVKNTLIVAPPSAGKTTFIRDYARLFTQKNLCTNITIIDERGEIAGNGKLDVGDFCDVLSFCSKKQGFKMALRTLSPKIIITDELGEDEDFVALERAFNNGIKVVATIHGEGIEDIKSKKCLKDILDKSYFDRFVVLSCRNGPGTIEGVFNKRFTRIGLWE